MKIKERIRRALEASGGRMGYHELLDAVFPVEEYPNSRRHSSNGGPPGCAFALGRALREMGCYENYNDGGCSRVVVFPGARKAGS